MADGKVTIAVDLDGKKAQGDINSLKSSLGGLGSTFKSVLGANLVSGALMNGINALTGSIKGSFSAAISEGAKLQQSIGGIETLFNESARTVRKNAEVAFRTAGISANEYMENVTSFSASLIQSLGGDTAAAADLANTALMDMSDNANKMGSDMGMITQTYQSLARGNYQMLDNLKLGYGGTKAELQRLIADAASYKDIQDELNLSVNEGDLSFANMVKAISVVQKKLGITGTTAKEASETFSGSFASMQASFKDFLGNLTTGGDIQKPLENLAQTASTFLFKNLIPMVGNVFKSLPKAIASFISTAKPELEAGLKQLLPEGTVNNIMGTFDKIGRFISNFKDTGALSAVDRAFGDLGRAIGNVLKALSGGKGDWSDFGTTLGNIVTKISEVISGISRFISSLPSGAIQAIVGGLLGLVAGFKAFNFLKSFNPFNMFKKNATSGVSGATSVVKSASTSIVSVIRSLGQSVAIAARGIGQGIGAAFRGIGQGLAMVNPATIAALAVPILALGAAFALMGMQGQGIATILRGIGGVIVSVGTAIGTILNQAIQGLAQALVIVAPVLPKITSSFAMLSPVITAAGVAISTIIRSFSSLSPVITALGSALSQVISAISSGVAEIATAITPIIEIISNAFVQIATVVSQAIVQIVQALSPFIPALIQMVQAVAPVLQTFVEAFNNLISQISPIIDSLTQLLKTFGEQVSSILDSASGVVESFGSAIRNVLDGVANIFESMGSAAKNAGQGVKLMAQGIKILVDLKLGDLVGTLAAVATGVGAIATQSGGLDKAGNGMKNLGNGMKTVSTSAMMAVVGLSTFVTRISTLSTTIGTLPSMMSTAASSFANFTAQAVSGVAGLSAINAPITKFKSQITTITPSLMLAGASFGLFGSKAMVISGAFAMIGGLITAFNARVMTISTTVTMASTVFSMLSSRVTAIGTGLMAVSTGFMQVGTSAVSAADQVKNMATSTQLVISAFNAMRGQVQSSMQAILSVIRSIGGQMKSQGRQIGQQTAQNIAQGIRGGIGQSTGAMQALMSAIRSVGMSGVGSMRYIGAMIGQGLAQGMYSALGAVTAAANALVAQAERAARAKAQIHSPSRLFRDSVGRFLPMGVAVGIEKNTKYVDKAMGGMYDNIQAFSYKAEDIIGVGKTKLSKVVQVKSDFENAIKAKVEVAKEKTNDLMEKALDIAEKAVERPSEIVLDDDTLIAKTGGKYARHQAEQTRRENRMRGIVT